MIEKLKELIKNKNVLILGYGREGQSSYQLLRAIFPEKRFTLADKIENHQEAIKTAENDTNLILKLGQNYLEDIQFYDFVLKSPGIKIEREQLKTDAILSSQTQIFLDVYSKQTIGITGTKGKSTTASLIHHVLSEAGKDVVLVGNIGIPPLSALQKITSKTIVIFELSAHQLEDINCSPRISVFLNIYEEHLDHFLSFEQYFKSKERIFSQAKDDQKFIFCLDQPILQRSIPKQLMASGLSFTLTNNRAAKCFLEDEIIYLNTDGSASKIIESKEIKNLIGQHNLNNIMAALLACHLIGLSNHEFVTGLSSFKSLEHRLEYLGKFKHIHFYNDSISTIPEATMAAVNSLPDTETLILGGFDRGIRYDELMKFLIHSKVKNLIFMGPAGNRMKTILELDESSDKKVWEARTLENVLELVLKVTQPGNICLLSPAAASYDQFKNFEERGNTYKKMARNL